MRSIITFCCCAVLCAAARADTIVLKNGDRIVADSVREDNGRVRYTIGDNSFALPKSIVVKIEAGPAPAPAPAVVMPAVALPPPSMDLNVSSALLDRVVRSGVVDNDALQAIERAGNVEDSAAAYAIAASFAESKQDYPSAARYLEAGLRMGPRHAIFLVHYASVLIQLGRYGEALSAAQQAASAMPQSAEAFTILGYAYYKNDRTRDAVVALKRSLQLRPDAGVQRLLNQVDLESRTEADFREQGSSHFTLRYEGSQSPDALRAQLLDILENDYRDLTNDLGGAPRNVYVSLYTDEVFFDVTQAPAWSAAVNDGKIRMPISGVTAVTPKLAGVLRHELTHSFVRQIAHERAPEWLNEGIAQLEQGLTTSVIGNRLAALYLSGRQIPLNQLEGRFDIFSREEATVAYAESLAATEYIRNTYGMQELAQILARLGAGQSIESALRSTIHAGYAELEAEITNYLKKNYGT